MRKTKHNETISHAKKEIGYDGTFCIGFGRVIPLAFVFFPTQLIEKNAKTQPCNALEVVNVFGGGERDISHYR